MAYNEKLTTMKGNTMTAKHSKPVRAFASICLVPKIVTMLPKAAIENVKVFAEDVKDEMSTRLAAARSVDRTVQEN